MSTNASLQTRKQKVFAQGQGNLYPIFVERADNAEVWDVEGNRYLDFGTGIAVCNTGHAHPKVVEAVQQQVAHFSHSCVMINPYESAVALAERLTQLAPGDSDKKAIFVTTGAEAVENAVKIARAHTGRRGVVAFNGGFHGRTNLTMGLTGKITPYKDKFGPFPGEIYHAPFPSKLHGVSVKDALKGLETLFKVDIAPSDVAAIIIEPIQGEGGFYVAPPELLQALRKLCDQHGIVLICDEIQSGFARTGHWFYTEAAGIEADIMTMAKGIAGGVPISAVVGKAAIMDAPPAGGLGGTYGGSPLGCAAALAVLDVIEQESLLEKARWIEHQFMETLGALKQRYPDLVGEVRGAGAMIAMELVKDGQADKPNPELTKALIGKASEYGLILLACGFYGNVIRLLPPLTIPEKHLTEGLQALTKLFDDCVVR
ncbi:4-aminobutyrate--2-oxoglutarate transaminase [Saliniradius amylolyticus]|uniref:4-aminobutyrate--2-oxoglutarate transaminase n=1 Tax=Saliniradius amylolyticus TaxID=2183582 RepID=A0A2S2E140_9ALTE|nr:4-aminobutyrate--2-oxoglutarate transaminase [Saliniradius amylolyticus]AWL10747.1 4-aminobutyrate--2-oxoglutarate transaminase [Saliniradius amylolyticus]